MVNRFTFLGLVSALAVFGLGLLVFTLADSSGNPPSIEAASTTPPSPQLVGPPAEPTATPAEPPTAPPRAQDLEGAAKAAGCTLKNPRNEGAEHVERETTAADYRSNPPTSGPHHPVWAQDGIHPVDRTPGLTHTVHALEHGRINVQYAPNTAPETIAELEQFVAGSEGGYHMLLFHNQTDMPYAVAATAWDRLIGCRQFNEKTVAALAAFRAEYIDQGPETVP